MTAPTPRRQRLEQMLAADPNDLFLKYGLALEVLREGDAAAGEAMLRQMTSEHPDYHAAHFRLAQLLAERGDEAEAVAILEPGIAAARRLGDVKAANEMDDYRQMYADRAG